MSVVVRDLRNRAGQGAFQGLSFECPSGLLAVLGPPNAGKATLLSLLAGVTRPAGGRIEINGVPPNPGDFRRRIGYVPAGAGLTPGLTVAEAFDFYLMLRRVHDPDERRNRIAATLEKLGLQGAAEGSTTTIPPSIAFVVTIAQACLIEPEILIVHEPPALTSEARDYARAVLRNFAAQQPVVLASEEARGMDRYAANVCVLEKGVQRFFGTPAEVTATATGHTWETELTTGQEASFVYGFVATRESATPDGRIIRGVSHAAPASQAKLVRPEFFDGYTWCLATDEATVRATQPARAPAAEAAIPAAGGAK